MSDEEPIDFALSHTSPYLVRSGGAKLEQSQESNSMGGTLYNFGYNSQQTMGNAAHGSFKKVKSETLGGAISNRVIQQPNPIQVRQTQYQNLMSGGAIMTANSTTQKQENTDSDFFNLTAEDES